MRTSNCPHHHEGIISAGLTNAHKSTALRSAAVSIRLAGRAALKRRHAAPVVQSDQAVVERALNLASSSYDAQQFPLPEEVHCPDAVVGVLSALEELGQPGMPYLQTSALAAA